ncbi:UNVERIFIED_CONTAM: hypothetical protein FKN15_040378 [Acipenser sinensis]
MHLGIFLKSLCPTLQLLLFLKAFTESEQTKLAMLTGILLANGTLPATILTSLFSDNIVKEGIAASFAVKLFKAWMVEKDANAVTSSLRKANLDKKLLELFPASKQNVEHFSKYFNDAGLKELSDFLRTQKSLGTRKELQKDLQQRLSQECPIKEKIQEYCYDNIHFMKSFHKIVVLFYKADVLSEEAILKWYKEAHVAKGKSVFLEQMKMFVEWLQNAEEESESEGDDNNHKDIVKSSQHLSVASGSKNDFTLAAEEKL